ncbi:MAG: class I SAM-dependent DNA methyltransferase, partial [Phormidesmis sp.]
QTSPTLEAIGSTYYTTRADLMRRNNQGLTDTYNRFHDPTETDPDIHHLRDLHSQMDSAVLTAYGWQDIPTICGFALDYLDLDPTETTLPPEAQARIDTGDLFFPTATAATSFDNLIRSATGHKRKLPWRYRWPDPTHDEVLARLLDLNQQRYDEEVKAGLHSKKKTGKKKAPRKKKAAASPPDSQQLDLI